MTTIHPLQNGRTMKPIWALAAFLVLLALVFPAAAAAQTDAATLAGQSLRPYWHVFVAYSLAWLLVFGWVVSIARRLARIEKRLGE